MRVVQLVMARQYRGAEMFAGQLSRQLKESGVEVLYVSLYEIQANRYTPERVDCIDLAGKRKGLLNFSLLWSLCKCLRDFKPDIVQANAGDTLKYAVLAKLISGLPFKIVFRNASMVSQYIRTFPQKEFNKLLYRQVDFIASVSGQSLLDMVSLFPNNKRKIAVIPNGIDSSKSFSKLSEFSSSDVNLVHVGGFTFEKNHDGLLRIFKMVKQKIPGAKLWLIGEGILKDEVVKQVNENNLDDSVVFTGNVSNPLDYIHSATALVLPSLIEGLPGVILEAFYCKTPVVAYSVGGISEVVKLGETGWLVPAGREIEFVQSILDCIKSNDRERIVEEAFKMVFKNYSNDLVTEKFITCYRNAAESS